MPAPLYDQQRDALFLSSVTLGIPEHELTLIYAGQGPALPVGVMRKSTRERWRYVESLEGLEPWADEHASGPARPGCACGHCVHACFYGAAAEGSRS